MSTLQQFNVLLFSACLGGGFAPCPLAAGGEPSTFQSRTPAPAVPSDSVPPGAGRHAAAESPGPLIRTLPPAATPPPSPPATLAPRPFTEADLLDHLTAVLQQDYVKNRGELELRLTRPWTARPLPDEALTLKILELPNTGLTPNCILRFELRTAREAFGPWQASVQAKVWRDIWIAQTALKRGQLLSDAPITRERRDVLPLRETLFELDAANAGLEMHHLELTEPLQTGTPLLARSVKRRPVIRRGQLADARLASGTLHITLKVEALEDGVPGQTIRVRNPNSRRDLAGKVLDEQTLVISL